MNGRKYMGNWGVITPISGLIIYPDVELVRGPPCRIHGTVLITYVCFEWHKFDKGKYTSPMDPI